MTANFDAIGDEYVSNFEKAYIAAIDDGATKKEAAERAAKIASKPFTRAMRRYAKLTKVKDAP